MNLPVATAAYRHLCTQCTHRAGFFLFCYGATTRAGVVALMTEPTAGSGRRRRRRGGLWSYPERWEQRDERYRKSSSASWAH